MLSKAVDIFVRNRLRNLLLLMRDPSFAEDLVLHTLFAMM